MTGKMSFVFDSVVDEVLDLLEDEYTDEDVSGLLMLCSAILQWAATGDMSGLPEELRNKAMEYDKAPQLALPAGEPMVAHT